MKWTLGNDHMIMSFVILDVELQMKKECKLIRLDCNDLRNV
jgi:hypothetical protein